MKKAKRLDSVKEYYFSRKLKEVSRMMNSGKPVINMGIGSPDIEPNPSVVKALSSAMSHPRAHMYQSYQGLPELRKTISSFYKKHYDVNLNPESEVLPLMGSKEGIMHLSMAFLNSGDEVLIPNPGYPTYSSVAGLMEAKTIFYDLNPSKNWQPDFEFLDHLDTSKVKIMWLNYPHMPTGTDVSVETFDKLILWARQRDILLINDNPYSFILTEKPQSILSRPYAKEVAVELNSLSKSFNMAGWRVGMMIGNEKVLTQVLKVKSNMDSGMLFGIQQGAIEALNMTPDWFYELNKVYKKRRELMKNLIKKLGARIEKEGVGLFLWARLPKGLNNSEAFIDRILKEKNIFITPGTVFGSQGEGYIRFSLCVSEEKIKEAIKRFES